MKTYLRYYATENLYHASAEYASGLGLDSRFPTLEKTAKKLLEQIHKENEEIPEKRHNGPTNHDIEQLNLFHHNPRPLSDEEEKRFLRLLGI
jgi:hypothetical protein